MLFTWLARANC